MPREYNGHMAGFFKAGNSFKCRVDEHNLKRFKQVLSELQEGDDIVLFARTDAAKQQREKEYGTKAEDQPGYNLTRIPAEEVKRNYAEWKAKQPARGI